MLEVRKKAIMSFCIPVFNSERTILTTVDSILKSKRSDIEIVLFYDESNDNTLEVINSIADNRVRVVINKTRMSYGNMLLECGKNADGKYLMYVVDRNYLSWHKIDSLLEYIEKNEDITCGMCYPLGDNVFIKYEDILDKMLKFAYQEQHITGHFFSTEMFLEASKEIENENFSNFPLDYLYAVICSKKGSALQYGNIFQFESDYLCGKVRTKSTKPVRNEWYSPSGRIRYYINAVLHLYKLEISKKDKKMVKRMVFDRVLFEATDVYKEIMRNVKICRHYFRELEYVGTISILIYRLQCYCVYLVTPFIVKLKN